MDHNLTELSSLSEICKESNVHASVVSDTFSISDPEDKHKCLPYKETKSTANFYEIECNSYSEERGFPGYSISENKGICNFKSVLLKESGTLSKYKYFTQFMTVNSKKNTEVIFTEEQDNIDGINFYSYETEEDMISSKTENAVTINTCSKASGHQSDDGLDDENIFVIDFCSPTKTNNIKESERERDVCISRSNEALDTIQYDEGFDSLGIQNVDDLSSSLLNDYFVRYNLDKGYNESSSNIGHEVNDHFTIDLCKQSVDDQNRMSANENVYEYFNYNIENSVTEAVLREDAVLVFKVCSNTMDRKRKLSCICQDKTECLKKSKHVDAVETANDIQRELNYNILSNNLQCVENHCNNEMKSTLNRDCKEKAMLADSNIWFQSIQSINEENSSSTYNGWDFGQKHTKETIKSSLCVKIQESKHHQQRENNVTVGLIESHNLPDVCLEKNKIPSGMNEECNSSKNIEENDKKISEYVTFSYINVNGSKSVEENISNQDLKNEQFSHKNMQPIGYSLRKFSDEYQLKQLKPCFVRIRVLQGIQNFKVRCIIHNKYECPCTYRNKSKVNCNRACFVQNKAFKNRKKNQRIIKSNSLRWKRNKKRKSTNCVNRKISNESILDTNVCVDGTSSIERTVPDDSPNALNSHNFSSNNLHKIIKTGKSHSIDKRNDVGSTHIKVVSDVDIVSLFEEDSTFKVRDEIFCADHVDSGAHLVNDVRAERNFEGNKKEGDSNIPNSGDTVINISDGCTRSNGSGLFTNASMENTSQESSRYDNEPYIFDHTRTSNVEVSEHGGFEEVTANVEREESIEFIPSVHETKQNVNSKIKDEVVEFEEASTINESTSSFDIFMEILPVNKLEKLPDSSENDISVLEINTENGILDVSKSFDSDFEDYTESSDELSDNSDEEIDESKDDIIIHKPLKHFASVIVTPLSKQLFNRPGATEYRERIPDTVIICTTPGIGYLHVIEHDSEKVVIEDPVNPKLSHQFSNIGHASNWLHRFFRQNVAFDYGVRLKWAFLQHKLIERAYHFNPEILKDKHLIVTENGVQKLSVNDSKELKRFHYRKKFEYYGTKLAYLVAPEDDISTLPLSVLLKKATQVVQREKETHLKLQYEVQTLSRTCSKLKMKLKTSLTSLKDLERNITKARRLVKRIERSFLLENRELGPKRCVTKDANKITKDAEKGQDNMKSETNESSAAVNNFQEADLRFLPVSHEADVIKVGEGNCAADTLHADNRRLASSSTASEEKDTAFSTHECVTTGNCSFFHLNVNKCCIHKGLAEGDRTVTFCCCHQLETSGTCECEIQNHEEVHSENMEYHVIVIADISNNEDCILKKRNISRDKYLLVRHGIISNSTVVKHTEINTDLLCASQSLSTDKIRYIMYKANLKKLEAWQSNQSHTNSLNKINQNQYKALLSKVSKDSINSALVTANQSLVKPCSVVLKKLMYPFVSEINSDTLMHCNKNSNLPATEMCNSTATECNIVVNTNCSIRNKRNNR